MAVNTRQEATRHWWTGLLGGRDFRTGEWQGFEGVDADATLNLGESVYVEEVSFRFLQDENAWIFFPLRVEFSVSNDGKTWRNLGAVESKISPYEPGVLIQSYARSVKGQVRYIRAVGVKRGVCPPGHKGEGGKSWIFADEIQLK
ncbi:MAG: hypothetical protein IPL49_11415 [Saprospirales bacterium]|nr:hypothetical protein [Saprospirales bacterium]